MTKSEAYDIITKAVKNACIPDVIYDENPKQPMMIAILSEIDSVNWVLGELVGKENAE